MTKCPTCEAPHPHLHPAVQQGGEVQPCRDAYHLTVTNQNTPERIDQAQAILALTAAAGRDSTEGASCASERKGTGA